MLRVPKQMPSIIARKTCARPWLSATDGYQAVWFVCGIPILAAIPLVYRLMKAERVSGKPTAIVA